MTLADHLEKWIKLFIGSLIFTVVGLGISYLAGQVSTLTCLRTVGVPACQYSVSLLERYPLQETAIQQLDSAYVEENCDSDGCTYRVILMTGYGSQAFTLGSDSNQQKKQELVDQINQFLEGKGSDRLEVKDGGGFWVVFTGLFILVGLGMGIVVVFDVLRYLWNLRQKQD